VVCRDIVDSSCCGLPVWCMNDFLSKGDKLALFTFSHHGILGRLTDFRRQPDAGREVSRGFTVPEVRAYRYNTCTVHRIPFTQNTVMSSKRTFYTRGYGELISSGEQTITPGTDGQQNHSYTRVYRPLLGQSDGIGERAWYGTVQVRVRYSSTCGKA